MWHYDVDWLKVLSSYPLQTQLSIGIKRNIEPQGQKGSRRKCVTSTNLLKFENGRQVTYLASYRKLHSKWQKWGDTDNIK